MFEAKEIVSQYLLDEVVQLQLLTAGLIHQTFYVETSRDGEQSSWILQKLHAKLSTFEIRTDYQRVTQYLYESDYAGPRMLQNLDQHFYTQDADGHYWRLITYVPGHTYDSVTDLTQIKLGATALAQFHTIIQGFPHPILSKHLGHNSEAHLNALHTASQDPQYQKDWEDIKEIGNKILTELPTCFLPDDIPKSIVHGDPKISNIRFQEKHAVMIDLDTCNVHSRLVDLGDAIRSWCHIETNPPGQKFCKVRYKTLIDTYREHAPPFSEVELNYLPSCARLITLELASRFAKDYLENYYFGFDRNKFTSRKSHNQYAMKEMYMLAQEMKLVEDQIRE